MFNYQELSTNISDDKKKLDDIRNFEDKIENDSDESSDKKKLRLKKKPKKDNKIIRLKKEKSKKKPKISSCTFLFI